MEWGKKKTDQEGGTLNPLWDLTSSSPAFALSMLEEQTEALIKTLDELNVSPLPGTYGIYRILPNTKGWIESVSLLAKDLNFLLNEERPGKDYFTLGDGVEKMPIYGSANSLEVLQAFRDDLVDIVLNGKLDDNSFTRIQNLKISYPEIFKNEIYLSHGVDGQAFSLDANMDESERGNVFPIKEFQFRVFSVLAKEAPLEVFEERIFTLSTYTGILSMELIHYPITCVHEGE